MRHAHANQHNRDKISTCAKKEQHEEAKKEALHNSSEESILTDWCKCIDGSHKKQAQQCIPVASVNTIPE